MKESGFHNKVISRYSDYEQVMWNHFQGIDEEAILRDLPRTLRQEIRSFTLSGLIKNWEAFPDGSSHSAIWSVIRKLKFVVYPANEVIITAGEIGHSMYFIIKGTVHVRGTDGNLIAILAKG
jgi:cyclic nucleotide gated channel, plant